MNQKLKYVGLLAILPLLTIPLTMNDAVADTARAEGHPGDNVVAFGAKTKHIVCGDKLCSEIDDKQRVTTAKKEINSEGPYAEQFGISSLGENMYKVTFTVYAGNEDLLDGVLHVSSDVANKEVPIRIFANSNTYVPVLILADDPSTILAWID